MILTYVELFKFPLPTNKEAPRLQRLFLLANTEIHFSLQDLSSLLWRPQILPKAIALVFAVHVHVHGQARCNVAIGAKMNREWRWNGWYSNESLDVAIPVDSREFLQWQAST